MPQYFNGIPNGINDLNRPEVSLGFPVGTALPWSVPQGFTLPPGWLLCDGAPYLQASFPELFQAIGTAHGDGTHNANGSASGLVSAFNVPDYRSVFHRGPPGGGATDFGPRQAQNTGGVASGVGSFEGHCFQGHWHTIYDTAQSNGGYQTLPDSISYFPAIGAAQAGQGRAIQTGFNGTVQIGAETRPDNVSTLFIIRASTT